MDVQQMIDSARESLSVRRVFGEPFTQDGVTVIPAAKVQGGSGGGHGDAPEGKGEGFGFGVSARPAGVFVVSGGRVRWQPALDVNRLVAGAQVVAVVALLTIRALVKARGR